MLKDGKCFRCDSELFLYHHSNYISYVCKTSLWALFAFLNSAVSLTVPSLSDFIIYNLERQLFYFFIQILISESCKITVLLGLGYHNKIP